MLKVAIVGYGFVGSAVAKSFLGRVDLYVCDTSERARERAAKDCEGFGVNICGEIQQLPNAMDAVFVCVPTPSMAPDGACDDRILHSVIGELTRFCITDTIISKCTAPVSTYKQLSASQVAYVPEFLRAAHADADYMNQSMVTIGSNDPELSERIGLVLDVSSIHAVPRQSIPREAAVMAKYAHNVSLAIKVAVMNEIQSVASLHGLAWDDVCKGLSGTSVASSHVQVPGPSGEYGFGGACFPKDVAAFLADAHQFQEVMGDGSCGTIDRGFRDWCQPGGIGEVVGHPVGVALARKAAL